MTHAVLEAARVFTEAVRREYHVWQCEEAVEVTLTAAEVSKMRVR